MWTRGAALVALALVAAGPAPARAQAKGARVELKIATLAPRGSSWAKILESGAKEIEQNTSGRVKLKFFFGGQQGDEVDAVRKMTIGQLDGAAVTSVGLGVILPDALVFQVPMLFADEQELDYVRAHMAAQFDKAFQQAGYVLLAWGDVGWSHFYTNGLVASKQDLQSKKMWVWNADPVSREFLQQLGINGVPLSVPNVLPSLQTGAIDGCYGSPLAAVALQWSTKFTHALDAPFNYAIGALVIRKDVFQQLSAADQQAVLTASATMGHKFLKIVRKDNGKATKAMTKQGIQFTATPPALVQDFQAAGAVTAAKLAGKVYSAQVLTDVQRHLATFRGQQTQTKGAGNAGTP